MSAQAIPQGPVDAPDGRDDAPDDPFGAATPYELLGAEHLADRARTLAGEHTVETRSPLGFQAPLLTRLNATERILGDAHDRLTAAANRNLDLGQAAEWFLDNYYIIHEHILQIRDTLPRGFYRELPRVREGSLAGYPRVYVAAVALIGHTEARLDSANIALFFKAYQEVRPLAIGELWAVPALLRLGLIECVRQIAVRLVERLSDLQSAEQWATRLIDASDGAPEALASALRGFLADPPRLTAAFVTRFVHRLRRARGAFPPLLRLRQAIAEETLPADAAATQSTDRLARTHVMVANAITSLRAVSRLDWPEFVEQQSVLDATLRTDPGGWYARMTFATRDRYRHIVEQIAKRSRRSEQDVAAHAIELARAASGSDDPRRGHVGYYLVDDGVRALEREVRFRPSFSQFWRRAAFRHPTAVYVSAIAAMTLLALWPPLSVARGGPDAALVLVVLFALLPALGIGVDVVNTLVTVLFSPRTLPKLDLQDQGGLPVELATAVVVPILLPNVEAVEEALANLEVEFLANRQPNLHFAILGDFVDAPTEHADDDGAIVAAATTGIRELNDRYASSSHDAFYLFHRPRRWNPRQGVWMGWERKRGKLAEFNRFIRGDGHGFSTIVGDVDAIRRVRYVITLDADTRLPPDAALELIGTLAHPLNRPVYDPAAHRVVRGYAILQPRVGVSLPSANRSLFSAIYSGQPGVDPYTTAVSDVYQDLFGEGSFTGKGIYDVEAFEEATRDRFPDDTLLSHDLIEGNYARAGLVTDVIVYDDYPARYLSYASRKHRWIRGDWQLLPWLSLRVPGPNGPERNRLSALARWKILDNLRRSTLEIAQLAFIVAGWTILPGSPLWWTGLGLAAIAAPWAVSLLLAAIRPPLTKSWRVYYRAVGRDALTSLKQAALAIVFLPHQAWLSADAIGRTVWRLVVSRRMLLEWRSASLTERDASPSARDVWRTMWPPVALVLALGLSVWVAAMIKGHGSVIGAERLIVSTVPLVALWMVSPWVARALSVSIPHVAGALSPANRDQAMRYALLHWRYFDQFATAQTHWLAPDNYQVDPSPVVAQRTSPTNIGLHLLAIASARDLGFITPEQMVTKLEQAFDTLGRMRRYRGHFLNWYDLGDLSPLAPLYVSTVDSGNLAGHLLALRQACIGGQAIPAAPADAAIASRLSSLAARAWDMVTAMDFSFLFDNGSKLFATGFDVATRTLDESFYDLLASEARLASFVAVAKKDVTIEHWAHLGRGLTHREGATALVSWSGSMFEYLMPALVMKSLPFTLLDESCRSAVIRQIAYGKARGVPWGVSESAYNVRDRHETYQYRGFGVPDLALRRGLERDLVVAPYATGLGSMFAPDKAIANFRALEALGALGPFGFLDAVDYTRPDPSRPFAIVRTYMAHHVGMTLVALTNVLRDNTWQDRFHSDTLVRSAELLLHERAPRKLEFQAAQPTRGDSPVSRASEEVPEVREAATPHTPHPRIVLLGHVPYTVMLSHAGSGWSRYQDLDVTRWRADGTRDNTGQFCYVKDLATGRVWSAAHHPACVKADAYHATLFDDRVSFERTDGDIQTLMDVVVVPEDAAEVRRIRVTNTGKAAREIELTSYGEIVLAPHEADLAHPAFSNLFVETEWHEWCSAVTATRRPRSSDERPLWLVHVVDTGPERTQPVTCETDRAQFIGRGRTTRIPLALEGDGPLSGTTGAVLDPIFALRARVRLEPHQPATITFTTLVADSRERAFELADRYHDPHAGQRALDLARTSTQAELAEFNISTGDAGIFQELASHLLYRNAEAHEPAERRGERLQSRLWALGVSGDLPILVATIDSLDGLRTLKHVFAAHDFWRRRGMPVDLVVINEHRATYLQELSDKIARALSTSTDQSTTEHPGGVFVRRRETINDDDLTALLEAARLRIRCDGRSLAAVVEAIPQTATSPADEIEESARPIGAMVAARTSDAWAGENGPANGLGALTDDGDYELHVAGDVVPPAPWVNVIANAHAGCVVSERGAGYTWVENSYLFRLTPWSNDPVSDPAGEAIYLSDPDSGDVWSATPGPRGRRGQFTVRHGPGRSTFSHERNGIGTELTIGMADRDAVKLSVVRLTNRDSRPRRLTITAYVEWTLGTLRDLAQGRVRTEADRELSAILATNTFDQQFAGWTAFCALSEPLTAYTADRREFLGRNGSPSAPVALRDAETLSGNAGPSYDPCAALQCSITLAPGASQDIVVALGAAKTDADARRTVAEYRVVDRATAALASTRTEWTTRLSALRVRTPEPTCDAMLNGWLLYQTLASRMWARTGLYQSSGAFGFRDQLQDSMALLFAEPGLAREHILRASARQFVEGDVQHWWHQEDGRGLRTRFSDDLVWLPFVADHYVQVTGDATVLDEVVPFLTMRALKPEEQEAYDTPAISKETGTVYEHCLRALRKASTHGAHDLPLIGSGDWNDGMNRVGVEGRGESVWLAWFLGTTLRAFASHSTARGDSAAASELTASATAYLGAPDRTAWDGQWYRRAYFDDGTPLGSAANEECQIDSIAQSWSVISGGGSAEHQQRAMQSLGERLVRVDARLIELLTPAFDKTPKDPGYIKGYVPGVRENGAQYTHAAVWAVLATALLGDHARAFELFQMLNPLTRTLTREDVATYKTEPYVVAADIYTAAGHLGRGGWTWYTGSSSWMYRVGIETLLGFTKRGATLVIDPHVPPEWPSYSIEYRYGKTPYAITVENPGRVTAQRAVVTVNGAALDSTTIPLVDDGTPRTVVIRPAGDTHA